MMLSHSSPETRTIMRWKALVLKVEHHASLHLLILYINF